MTPLDRAIGILGVAWLALPLLMRADSVFQVAIALFAAATALPLVRNDPPPEDLFFEGLPMALLVIATGLGGFTSDAIVLVVAPLWSAFIRRHSLPFTVHQARNTLHLFALLGIPVGAMLATHVAAQPWLRPDAWVFHPAMMIGTLTIAIGSSLASAAVAYATRPRALPTP